MPTYTYLLLIDNGETEESQEFAIRADALKAIREAKLRGVFSGTVTKTDVTTGRSTIIATIGEAP